MKTIFMYAGQGSQCVGMGKDFYEEYEIYKNFVDSFEFEKDFKSIMHDGELTKLSETENTQPCMSLFAAGITKLLEANGIKPDGATGLSLGEYGALYAAGVFSAEDYVNITAFRGMKMAEAAKGCNCSMSAILGLESNIVKKICDEYDGEGFITVANYNCPGQYVICGDEIAVANVEEKLKAEGAKRCVRLNVSGPFHTKYMKMAGDALKEYFENIEFNEPNIKVALNYTGDFYKANDDIKNLLVLQVQNSVQMENDLRSFLADGARYFIEIGPGNTLSGFLKKTAKSMGIDDIKVTSISKVSDFEKLISENIN